MINTESDVNIRELVVNDILRTMSTTMDVMHLHMLEDAVRNALHGLDLVKECTEVSTELDNTEYILNCFVVNKKLEGCQDGTLDSYVRTVRKFLGQCGKLYTEVTKDDVKYYLALRSTQIKKNSLVNEKRNLSSFFTWLHDEGFIKYNPVKPIKGIRGEDVEMLYFTLAEEIAIRDVQCSLRNKAIIAFLLSTGVRVGELSQMDRSCVDLFRGEVTFRGEKSRVGKYRTVYLDAYARKYIGEYLATREDNNPALFVSERKYKGEPRRIGNAAFEKVTHAVVLAAGITDKRKGTVHVFRRTFATRLASHGCPIEVIQELMGHADPGTTLKHYVAKSRERMYKVWERHSLVA